MISIIRSLKVFLSICLFTQIGLSQNINLDSLRNVWNDKTRHDSIRLKAHRILIQAGYLYAKIDSALVMIEENLSLSKEKGTAINKGEALELLGIYNARMANMTEALKYFRQSQDIFSTTNNINKQLSIKYNIGLCFTEMGNTAQMLKVFEEIVEIASEQNELKYVLNAKRKIATYHMDNGSTKIAMDNFKEVVKLSKELNDQYEEAGAYLSLGIMEEKGKDYQAAEKYFKESHKIAIEQNIIPITIYALSNLARMSSLKGDSLLALSQYKKSLEIADSDNDWTVKMIIIPEVIKFYFKRQDTISAKPYILELQSLASEKKHPSSLAKAYFYSGILKKFEGNHKESLSYCKKAREIFINSKINQNLKEVCNCIYESEKKLGNDKAALVALEEYMTIRDTLFNEDREISFAKLTSEYQYEKEKEITDTAYQANLERQQLIQKGLGIGLGLLGLLAFFIFRGYRNKQKANQLLASKNEEIETQKEQLEQLNQTKDRIFAILGHDMRKPTIAFRGIARKVNYLLGKKDFARLEQLGESIERDALGLNNLTDNLLNWALTQKNALPHQPEQIQLSKIIQEVFMTLGRLAEDKNIHLSSEITDDTMVTADKNALLTIIRNLVDNAIKFTPEKRTDSHYIQTL